MGWYGIAIQSAAAMMDIYATAKEGSVAAQVARRNAVAARAAGGSAIQAGLIEEERSRLQYGDLRGAQIAAASASGADVASASVQKLVSDTQVIGEHDAAIIRSNAIRESFGYEVQAANYEAQAVMAKYSSRSTAFAKALAYAGSIGYGASQIPKGATAGSVGSGIGGGRTWRTP